MRQGWLSLAAWIASKLPDELRLKLYHLGPLTHAIRAALSRAAPAGLVEVTVAGGLLRGIHMRLDLQTEKDLWLGNHEPEVLATLRKVTPLGGTAYDVGANVGLISLGLADWVGSEGRVIAFEAMPENADRLAGNLSLNPTGARVTLIAAAVGKQMGEAEFLIHPSGGMGKLNGSAGRNADYAGRVRVPVVSLDGYVFEQGGPAPAVIKIDVEGGEGMVLQGAERILATYQPLLMLELHGPEAAQQVWQVLVRHGYQVRRLDKGHPVVSNPSSLGWKSHVITGEPAALVERLA
jgi:FkbM family methyltransferase